jgi:SAM-dependent methyltransferase
MSGRVVDGTDQPHGVATEFWDDFYAGGRNRWSGDANALLVDEVTDLAPGTALDLGCGQGGDAIWLAGWGWRVTAVDVAEAALAFGAEQAAAAGVGDAITWQRHDLDATFPAGEFDLVTTCYLQSPVELGREAILRHAAAAVAPGGTLVVVGHAAAPTWATPGHHGHGAAMPSAAEVLDALALGAGWDVQRCADVALPATSPDGVAGTRRDSVVRARRSLDETAGRGGTA